MNDVVFRSDALNSISCLSLYQKKLMIASSKNVPVRAEKVGSDVNLLHLPREIRDHIFSLLFLSDGPIYPSKDRARISEYLGLLRANRQIYSEVVDILYGRNTFQIRGTPPSKAPELLNVLSSQRRVGYLNPCMWALGTVKSVLLDIV